MAELKLKRHPYLQDHWKPPLFDDPKFSDAKLIFGTKTIHVHRVVLSMQSTYFAKAFGGEFREAEEREIHYPEEEFDLWYLLISVLYIGQRHDLLLSPCGNDLILHECFNSLRLNNCFEFLAVVDYIDAPQVRSAVYERIIELLMVAAEFSNDDENIDIAEICHSTRAIYQLQRFMTTAQIFQITLLNELKTALWKVYKTRNVKKHLHKEPFLEMFRDVPQLATDLLGRGV